MTTKNIANFSIPYTQYLKANGSLTLDAPKYAIAPEFLISVYQTMKLSRLLDHKAIALQRTGHMRTYPAAIGQEAVGTGIGTAMKNDDVFCSYYRDQSTYLARHLRPSEILRYWGGDVSASNYSSSVHKHDLPICVPIATQTTHAVGIAYAIKFRKQARAVCVTIGDGGTSKGDFYEAINAAGLWQLPIVFVINNNQWAISVPREKQTASCTLAQKAIAGGIEGRVVDGNDIVAMHDEMSKALKKAREGKGPTVIEAITYRLCDHTTADDATRYIPEEKSKEAWALEPLIRLRTLLTEQHGWNVQKETDLNAELKQFINTETEIYLNHSKAKPLHNFQHLYETLPTAYVDQIEETILRNNLLDDS